MTKETVGSVQGRWPGRQPERKRPRLVVLLLAVVALCASVPLGAQVVVGGDFDICDYCATAEGNTLRVRGRSGFGTTTATFRLVNAANDAQDVDRDGYTAGVDFTDLFISAVSDFVNVADPNRVIATGNFVLADFLNPLRNGFQNDVRIAVNVPTGTPAGIYRGSFSVADSVKRSGSNPNGELLRVDNIFVEVEVLPDRGIALVEANTATELDSLVLAGRPGQTVRGVVRVANLGNVNLSNVRIEATDLIATSGTGLTIRSDRISFTPETITNIALGDTSRVTVTVRIPLGILAGRYRGELIVQGDNVAARRVPLTVIVTTPGDIVFENNPVFGRNGDNAVIIFNGDPGTPWSMRIFDMQAITTFAANGVVFAGSGGGTPTDPQFIGDEAVRYTWTLENGRGESVAAGMYLVVIEATQAGQRRQLRGKLMVIR